MSGIGKGWDEAMEFCRTSPGESRENIDRIKAGILAMADAHPGAALAAFLGPERERAERPIREYVAFADGLGIDRETAQRVLSSQPTYAEARLALRTISFAATYRPLPGADPVNPPRRT